MSVEIKKATITLTEQTVREIVAAMEKARLGRTFTCDPMPTGDMSSDTYRAEQEKRGVIFVGSEYSPYEFRVLLEVRPHSQESAGYRLLPTMPPGDKP